MNVSLNWLATHLDLGSRSVQELDDLLTFAGVEVEGIETRGVTSPRVVVAEIKEAVPHPNADRLKVTQVDCGEGALRQIVCGAKNYRVGDKVPCALPGAELPGGFTIGETVMRKVESRGMLCAAAEIGLPEGEDGLLILPQDAVIGRPVKEMYDSDVLLELEVTPNRPDLLSHRGMARELAALLGSPLRPLDLAPPASRPAETVRLESPAACPLYTALRIDGVAVGESPPWLRQRLESIGLRPINNVVDVTNFVLHELGQPLHAFDLAKLEGGIVVRQATAGEGFHALDGSRHELLEEDLVIADGAGAVLALAGVMGGAESGVTEETRSILLESAWFAPQGIRRTSRRSGLSSDSSYRFERGVDPQGVLAATALALRLIVETAGGRVAEAVEVAGELPAATPVVELDAAKLDQLTGGSIPLAEAGEILGRLGLVRAGEAGWQVPSFRGDLRRHIDLVEEIVRVHGLGRVPSRALAAFVPASAVDAAYDADMILRRRLAGLGLHECQTIKLISDPQLADALPLKPLQEGDLVRVRLPLSEDHAVLRPSLAPGLVASAERNLRQQVKSLRLFELGRVFRHAGGGRAKDQEAETLGLLISGPVRPGTWAERERAADVHDALGLLAALLPRHELRLVPREREGFVLACDVKAGEQNLGVLARLRPAREREIDATAPVFLAELDLAKLRRLLAADAAVRALPQFPGSSRDAAMELPASTPNARIEAAIAKAKEPLLAASECFDVFTDPSGAKLAADRKSVAYRFHYRAADRTLKSEEIDAAHQRLLQVLAKELGANFR